MRETQVINFNISICLIKAQTKKIKLVQKLLVACRECEAKYLIRSLQGKLRIGLAEQSVLTALGQAVAITPFHSVHALLASGQSSLPADVLDTSRKGTASDWKAHCDEVVGKVKQAYAQCPNYEKIVQSLLEDGPESVHKRCCITPGIPLRPMLAHPTHGVTDVLKRFDDADFTCEYKYDGERAQVETRSLRYALLSCSFCLNTSVLLSKEFMDVWFHKINLRL